MDCNDVRRETPAYLYDELKGADRARLEEHLEGCRVCREHVDGNRTPLKLLDAWPSPGQPADERIAALLVEYADARHRGGRTRRLWTVLASAAAAVLVFGLLAFLHAEAEVTSGRVRLSFGARPETSAPVVPTRFDESELRPLVHRVAVNTVDDRLQALAEALAELLADRDRVEEARLVRLARAFEARRDQDVHQLGRLMEEFSQGVYLESRRTREAVEASFTWILDDGVRLPRPLKPLQKRKDGVR
jgi:hypothetical protein